MPLSISRYLRLLGSAVIPAVFIFAFAVNGQDDDTAAAIEISAFEELCKIGVDERYPLDGDYILTKDIDASESRKLNDGAGFLPIGRRVVIYRDGSNDVLNPDSAFTGTFDGGGHTISGLYIKRTASDEASGAGINIGLFGFALGAEIRNVTVDDTVIGYSYVGALVGRQSGGVVEKCVAKGAVVGKAGVGGLVGAVENGGTVKTCYSSVDVSGESVVGDVGGFAGSANGAEITECYSIGTVRVDGGVRVGGFAGWLNDGAKLSNSYSVTAVSGGDASSVGGLAGKVEDGCEVKQCYSAGAVSGGGAVGGLIGTGNVASFCYWDKERSGVDTSAGSLLGAVGRTTVQMMTASDMGNLSAASWGISNNYPYLKNEFFPKRAVTVTATLGGALSGVTAANKTVHTQVANRWIAGNTVTAAAAWVRVDPDSPDSVIIVDSLAGWYLAGSNEKLDPVNEYEELGFSVAEASVSGTTGTLSLSDLTADSVVAIEARFILKKYTLKYIAKNGRGSIASLDDDNPGTGNSAADTLVKLVEYGAVSSVTAAPNFGFKFAHWSWRDDIGGQKKSYDPARADTVRSDSTFIANFADSTIFVRLIYTAGDNGSLVVSGRAGTVKSDTADVRSGANGPTVRAIAIDTAVYRFVKWSDDVTANPRIDSTVVDSINVVAIFDTILVAVKSPDRIIPDANLTNATSQIQPVKTISGGFTAGPNPVSIQNGKVSLFWQGSKITAGTLLIFDANGNFVNKITINDNNNSINKRTIATWNLTDAKGNLVGAGTYLIKGTLSANNGKSEKVALIVLLI